MTANDYVKKYHGISVPEYKMQNGQMYASNFVNTPVDEYLNMRLTNRAGFPHSERRKVRLAVKDILVAHADQADKPVTKLGKGYGIGNSIHPCAYVDNDMLKDASVGKASPETVYACIQALSYWRGWRMTVDGAPPPSLPDMVDMFHGMDCNGFVGNYMKSKYGQVGFKLGPSTPEEDYYYNRKVIRDDPSEIRADDIILELRTPKEDSEKIDWKLSKKELEKELSSKRSRVGHIMVISSVHGYTNDMVDVMISESRTSSVPNGGPQTRPFQIRRTGAYRWDVLNRDREIHSILKVKGTGD
jgi:hypothetical protein